MIEDQKPYTDWSAVPYIDYIAAVDALLEAMGSEVSNHKTMGDLDDGQTQGWTPLECAEWIISERAT